MATNDTATKGAYSVNEFCQQFGGFTKPHFYNLLKTGKAPVIFKLGKRTLISHESATKWVQRMELETVQAATVVK